MHLTFALYGSTLFLSAFLVFVLQPLVGKWLLPFLGGSPSVWSTTLVFFQGVLLLGYLYTHLSSRLLNPKMQALLHLGLLLSAVAFLPLSLSTPAPEEILSAPQTWLILKLLTTIGLPFLLASATAPLLQKWYSSLSVSDPDRAYHLYVASNLGSLGALLTYPLLIEPHIDLLAQSRLWAALFFLLIALSALTTAVLWTRSSPAAPRPPLDAPPPITTSKIATWIALALLPSALLLATTRFLTEDLSPIPLLWLVPLALYLLSFILAFSPHQALGTWLHQATGGFILLLVLLFFLDHPLPLSFEVPLHLLTLFAISVSLHRRLFELRPDTSHLTDFYLYLSLGGVLGGIFVALLVPILSPVALEYPLLLGCSALALSLIDRPVHQITFLLTGPVLLSLLVIALWYTGEDHQLVKLVIALAMAVFLVSVALKWPGKFPLVVFSLATALSLRLLIPGETELTRERTFFGIHKVQTDSSGLFHKLYHGRTNHGVQARFPSHQSLPLAYYHPTSPIADVFALLEDSNRTAPVAVVGLGTGSLAAYSLNRRPFHFYEIDPAVIEIATNPDYFTYLEECDSLCDIVLGDGRLKLQESRPDTYDLIVLDAYTSAAIPLHLLTRQAFEIYLDRLRPNGLLAIHISNPYLDLSSPLANLASSFGLQAILRFDSVDADHEYYDYYAHPSIWVVIASNDQDRQRLQLDPNWESLPHQPTHQVWTDDYANLLSTVRFLTRH